MGRTSTLSTTSASRGSTRRYRCRTRRRAEPRRRLGAVLGRGRGADLGIGEPRRLPRNPHTGVLVARARSQPEPHLIEARRHVGPDHRLGAAGVGGDPRAGRCRRRRRVGAPAVLRNPRWWSGREVRGRSGHYRQGHAEGSRSGMAARWAGVLELLTVARRDVLRAFVRPWHERGVRRPIDCPAALSQICQPYTEKSSSDPTVNVAHT